VVQDQRNTERLEKKARVTGWRGPPQWGLRPNRMIGKRARKSRGGAPAFSARMQNSVQQKHGYSPKRKRTQLGMVPGGMQQGEGRAFPVTWFPPNAKKSAARQSRGATAPKTKSTGKTGARSAIQEETKRKPERGFGTLTLGSVLKRHMPWGEKTREQLRNTVQYT